MVEETLRSTLTGHRLLHLIYGARFADAAHLAAEARNQTLQISRQLRTRVAIAQCLALVAQGKVRTGLQRAMQIGTRQMLPGAREAWVTEELSVAHFVAAFRSNGPAHLPMLMRRFEGGSSKNYRPYDTTFQLAKAAWLLVCGKVAAAATEIVACSANAQFHDPSGLGHAVAALHAQTAALSGDSATAKAKIAQVQWLPAGSGAVIRGSSAAHLAAARYLLTRSDAQKYTLAEAELFTSKQQYGFAAEVLHSGIRFGDQVAAREFIELHPHLDGELFNLYLDQARAVLSEDPLALIAAAQRIEAGGLILHALEIYGLLAKLDGATVPEMSARRGAHESSRLLAQVGKISHPLLPQARAADQPQLTKRELEVQQLILSGLSNREIADRLGLSARTVEGHIARLYRKTGDSRRDPSRRSTGTVAT